MYLHTSAQLYSLFSIGKRIQFKNLICTCVCVCVHVHFMFANTCCLLFLIIQIAYGRFLPNSRGYRDLDLFIQQKDGKKIVDPEKQSALTSCIKKEMFHPLRVIMTDRGPDVELLVANPVELCGKGRPRVFYDVTLALKALGICIFSVRNHYLRSEVVQRPISMLASMDLLNDS